MEKINRYNVKRNAEGYIEAVVKTDGEMCDFEGQIAAFPDICHGWYKLEDGSLYVDEIKKAQILEEIDKLDEIRDLKNKLDQSNTVIMEALENIISLDNSATFVLDYIKAMRSFRSTYSAILANRKVWRARLKELED